MEPVDVWGAHDLDHDPRTEPREDETDDNSALTIQD